MLMLSNCVLPNTAGFACKSFISSRKLLLIRGQKSGYRTPRVDKRQQQWLPPETGSTGPSCLTGSQTRNSGPHRRVPESARFDVPSLAVRLALVKEMSCSRHDRSSPASRECGLPARSCRRPILHRHPQGTASSCLASVLGCPHVRPSVFCSPNPPRPPALRARSAYSAASWRTTPASLLFLRRPTARTQPRV